jgi:hypothetical protein
MWLPESDHPWLIVAPGPHPARAGSSVASASPPQIGLSMGASPQVYLFAAGYGANCVHTLGLGPAGLRALAVVLVVDVARIDPDRGNSSKKRDHRLRQNGKGGHA